jgi:hypothetical protein
MDGDFGGGSTDTRGHAFRVSYRGQALEQFALLSSKQHRDLIGGAPRFRSDATRYRFRLLTATS